MISLTHPDLLIEIHTIFFLLSLLHVTFLYELFTVSSTFPLQWNLALFFRINLDFISWYLFALFFVYLDATGIRSHLMSFYGFCLTIFADFFRLGLDGLRGYHGLNLTKDLEFFHIQVLLSFKHPIPPDRIHCRYQFLLV